MRLDERECERCGDTGKVKVKIGWCPNPKDRVGYMPPIVEYESKPCPACRSECGTA